MLGKTYKEWMTLEPDERLMWQMFVKIRAKKDDERRVEEHNKREMEEYDKVQQRPIKARR